MAPTSVLDRAPKSGALTRPRSSSAWLLRFVRVLADLHQYELSQMLQLSMYSICNYESGKRTPSRSVRQLLATGLNCPELLLWEPEPIADEMAARRRWRLVLARHAKSATTATERALLQQLDPRNDERPASDR